MSEIDLSPIKKNKQTAESQNSHNIKPPEDMKASAYITGVVTNIWRNCCFFTAKP